MNTIGIDVGSLTLAGKHGMRYAQKKGGQKLHIVPVNPDGSVSCLALCGRRALWRMSINVPLGMCCRSCSHILKVRTQ